MEEQKEIEEVCYYWYDHLLIRFVPKLMEFIKDILKNHDYHTFKTIQYILNHFSKEEDDQENYLIYLPNEVFVKYNDGTSVEKELSEELFNRIAFSEYECG